VPASRSADSYPRCQRTENDRSPRRSEASVLLQPALYPPNDRSEDHDQNEDDEAASLEPTPGIEPGTPSLRVAHLQENCSK
jgi:hypothetical protein